MRALIVLDVQKGFLKEKDFSSQLAHIDQLMDEFNETGELIIATRHLDEVSDSIIYEEGKGSPVDEMIASKSHLVIEKRNPNAFIGTELAGVLEANDVDELVITGFNSEYCCLFTSIAGADRGYEITFIEDACGSVNEGEVYEYENLDVTDFIATVLHWSGSIQVLDYEEYLEGGTDE
jgi:nicotinamidase-related amidase